MHLLASYLETILVISLPVMYYRIVIHVVPKKAKQSGGDMVSQNTEGRQMNFVTRWLKVQYIEGLEL